MSGGLRSVRPQDRPDSVQDIDLRCTDCGAIEWRQRGAVVLGDGSGPAVAYPGTATGPTDWTCACGTGLAATDARSLALDALAMQVRPGRVRPRSASDAASRPLSEPAADLGYAFNETYHPDKQRHRASVTPGRRARGSDAAPDGLPPGG